MNFSETVFVLPPADDGHARIRIFTPAAEIPFAGHPTLGNGVRARRRRCSSARSGSRPGTGSCPVQLEREGARIVFGRMQQPVPTVAPYDGADELLAALGVERSELPVEVYDNGIAHVFVCLGSPERGRRARPDLVRLGKLPAALGVNCFAGSGDRWKTRMFAPGGGVAEDPATGSAAGPLAVHLAPPRADRVRRGDRDHPGRRDPAPVDALRAGRRARRSGSSASRSAARRWSSRAASSACRSASYSAQAIASISGQLERERRARSGRRRARGTGGRASRRARSRDRRPRSRPPARPGARDPTRARCGRRRARRRAAASCRRRRRPSSPAAAAATTRGSETAGARRRLDLRRPGRGRAPPPSSRSTTATPSAVWTCAITQPAASRSATSAAGASGRRRPGCTPAARPAR